MMKSLSIYFGYHNLAFLNSFLNILNNYVLVLFWGPRADEVGAEGRGPRIRVEGRGSRNTNGLRKIIGTFGFLMF